jgi:Putative beta barrel porin-7 (BBP7)
MSMQRSVAFSLLAVALAGISRASDSEFNTRLATWQGGGVAASRAAVQPAEESAQSSPTPASARLLAESWKPPTYPSNYDTPRPPCASCGGQGPAYGPGYASVSDGDWEGGYASDGGYGTCGSCGDCGPGCNTLVWAKFDVLLWWRQGRDFPPLVTTDPVSEASTTAGILPDAQVLFGGGRVGSNMQAGGRIDIGCWCDPQQCWGYGWRFFGVGKDATEFNVNSLDNPVLAIPFFNATTSQNDALLVAYPGLRSGEIHIVGNSGILGNDVYGRFLLSRNCDSRLDFITGWNYTRINDGIEIRSRSIVTETGGNVALGTETVIRDQFDARNQFNGGILGLMYERNCGCWTTNLMARMSLGNMHERMVINGSTRITVPGQPAQTTSGGLFTAASNIGSFSRNEFTAITEAGVNLGYRWGPCTRINIGYTFMYWNDVLTPGKAIDTSVDPTGGTRPAFTFRHSDYWVQGLNLGLVREF